MPIIVNKEFVKLFKNITNQCEKHLVQIADAIGKDGMELSDLKNFGSCHYKKGDKSYTLYSNADLIITNFYEKEKKMI